MALRGTLLILTGISWFTVTVSAQSDVCMKFNEVNQVLISERNGQCHNAELYVEIRPQPPSCATTTCTCNLTTCSSMISPNMTMAAYQISSYNITGITSTTTINQTCPTITTTTTTVNHTTTITNTVTSTPQQLCTITTTTTINSHITQPCTTPSPLANMPTIIPIVTCSSPTTKKDSCIDMLMATRTWFTTAILVLIAIIIMLVVMLGYLVRRTTAKKEVVVVLKNTDQPLTETTSEAVAMSQLQTSTEPEYPANRESQPPKPPTRLTTNTVVKRGPPSQPPLPPINNFIQGPLSRQPHSTNTYSAVRGPSLQSLPPTNDEDYSALQQGPPSQPPLPPINNFVQGPLSRQPHSTNTYSAVRGPSLQSLPPINDEDYSALQQGPPSQPPLPPINNFVQGPLSCQPHSTNTYSAVQRGPSLQSLPPTNEDYSALQQGPPSQPPPPLPPTDSEDSSVVQRPLCHQPHSTCRYSQGPFSPSLISNKATQQQEFPTSDSEYSVVQRGASPVSLPSTDDGDYSVVQGPFSPSLTSNKEYPIVQQESPTNNTDYSVVQRGSSQHSLPPINDDEEYSALRQEPPSHLPFSTNDYSVLQQESPTFSPLPTNNAGYSFVQQVPHSNTRYSKLSIVHKHPSLDQQHNYEDIEEIQRKRGDGTNEEADASV